MTKPESIRVLMIGPGEGIGGGISALIDVFLPVLSKRIPLSYMPSVKQRQLKDSGKLSFRNLIIAFSQYFRFLIAILRFHPNIIHLHTSQGIAWLKDTFYVVIGKVFHCRIILHMHGGNFDTIYDEYPPFLQAYTRGILGIADVIVALSVEGKNRLERFIPVDRIVVLKNCIDVKAFQPVERDPTDGQLNLLFIGRIGRQKGTFDLVDAIHFIVQEKIPLHAWLVGPEEREGDGNEIIEYIENYHLTEVCDLLGLVDREKVIRLYENADIFVLPSYYEGLPMVILEALAAGLPIVATPVGGIPEVVRDDYNGYLVPKGEVQSLAQKLTKLIKDPELRIMMGKHSREIAELDFDVGIYIDRLIALYASIS